MNKLFILSMLFVMPSICQSGEAGRDDLMNIAALVADNAIVGTIDEIKDIDSSSQLGYFDVLIRTSTGVFYLISDDPSFNKKYFVGAEKFIIFTREWVTPGGVYRRFLLPYPYESIFKANENLILDIDEMRGNANHVAIGYIKSESCDERYRRRIIALAGRDQQRLVKLMYDNRPLSAGKLSCMINELRSDKSVSVKSLKLPWGSREGVFHHNYSRLGDLVGFLIPYLINFPAPKNDDDIPIEKLVLAWGYWGSVTSRP